MIDLSNRITVVPIDFSDACSAALDAPLAEAPADKVHLVHVIYSTVYAAGGEVIVSSIANEEQIEKTREQFAAFLKKRGLPDFSTEVLVGDPGKEIVEYADRIAADLIVVPSHGFHGWRRLMLGSVTERIVRLAHCPVLVLRRADAQ
ncbi:MAG: universal stress protein [Pseudomonadota bacterium]